MMFVFAVFAFDTGQHAAAQYWLRIPVALVEAVGAGRVYHLVFSHYPRGYYKTKKFIEEVQQCERTAIHLQRLSGKNQ